MHYICIDRWNTSMNVPNQTDDIPIVNVCAFLHEYDGRFSILLRVPIEHL